MHQTGRHAEKVTTCCKSCEGHNHNFTSRTISKMSSTTTYFTTIKFLWELGNHLHDSGRKLFKIEPPLPMNVLQSNYLLHLFHFRLLFLNKIWKLRARKITWWGLRSINAIQILTYCPKSFWKRNIWSYCPNNIWKRRNWSTIM